MSNTQVARREGAAIGVAILFAVAAYVAAVFYQYPYMVAGIIATIGSLVTAMWFHSKTERVD